MRIWVLLLGTLLVRSLEAGVVMHSGFEQPDAGGGYAAYLAGAEVDGWVVEAGSVEIVGTYWQAAEGNQSMDLSGIWDWAGTIYRDVATVPGKQYKLRFALAGNPEDGDATKRMKAFWNGTEVTDLSVNTKDRSFTSMGWEYHEYVLTADSTTTRLKFQSLTLNFLGPVIDDVSLTEVTGEANLQIKTYAGIWLTGTPGSQQEIQFSANGAQSWRTLITVTIPEEGKLFFLDPEPVRSTQRMYRAVQVE
jgi:choice-of-anchor C domain-containing protein